MNTNQTSLCKERSMCFLSPCLSTSPFTSRKVQSQRLYLYCSTGTVGSLKPNSTVILNSYIHCVNSWGDPADPMQGSLSILRLSIHWRKNFPIFLTPCLYISVPLQKNTWSKHIKWPSILPVQNSRWAVKGRMGSVGSFHEINGCMMWDLMSP